MSRPTEKLTYANVISTICLFLLLGGGAAYASSHVHLGKNSVGTNQLKKNAVTNAKIKQDAVTGSKVKDGSLTGADIDQSTLTSVRASNVSAFAVDNNCGAVSPFPAGVAAERTSTGVCKFTFPSQVAGCAVTGTAHLRLQPNEITIAQDRTVQLSSVSNLPNVLVVSTYAGAAKADMPFDMTVAC